jgi:Flp pilus assembly protein TadG
MMLAHCPRKHRRDRRRGAAVVEFAVVAPILMVFILGIIEIGRLVNVAQVTTNCSREGARYAVQGAANTSTIDEYLRTYLASAGMSNTAAGGNSAVTVKIEYQSGSAWVVTTDPAANTIASGTPLRVTVEVNFDSQTWLPSRFFVGNNTKVQGVTVMRKE